MFRPGVSARAIEPASFATDRTDDADASTDQMVSDGDGWFRRIIKRLLPNDAGLQLHLLTGFIERTCYRYCSGERQPPGFFIRALLRSDHGWTWLCAFMDGCDAPWWSDLQRKLRNAERLDALKLE